MRGTRITLTTDIEALGTRHRAGDQGTVEEEHTDGYLTARMDDGRAAFPTRDEVHTRGALKGLGPAVPTVSTPRRN